MRESCFKNVHNSTPFWCSANFNLAFPWLGGGWLRIGVVWARRCASLCAFVKKYVLGNPAVVAGAGVAVAIPQIMTTTIEET